MLKKTLYSRYDTDLHLYKCQSIFINKKKNSVAHNIHFLIISNFFLIYFFCAPGLNPKTRFFTSAFDILQFWCTPKLSKPSHFQYQITEISKVVHSQQHYPKMFHYNRLTVRTVKFTARGRIAVRECITHRANTLTTAYFRVYSYQKHLSIQVLVLTKTNAHCYSSSCCKFVHLMQVAQKIKCFFAFISGI